MNTESHTMVHQVTKEDTQALGEKSIRNEHHDLVVKWLSHCL